MTSEQYAQLLDDFELGADVGPDEDLTSYIERRRKEFESKADGGMIGIEVLFGPKRDEFSIGGRAQPATLAYDSRANIEDFTKALKSVSGGTTYQQQADAQRYARNKANEMLTSAMRSGNQSGIQSIFQGVGGPTSMGGMQFNRSGNRITSVPATGPGRDKIINAMAQEMLKYTPSYQSLKPQPRDNLGLLMSETMLTNQMKSPAEMEAIRQKVLAAQKAQEQSYFMTDPVTGKKYSSEAEAIDDLGIVTYNQRFADGGRVPMVSGGVLKGIMNLFKGGDKAADLAKQEEIFRSGPITAKFLEDVDNKVIDKFVRSRDAKGIGSYGLYDNFDDMPAGLKAAEILKRFVDPKTGKINYEDAEFFIGRKLKGDETIDELINIAISKPIGTGSSPFKDFEEYVLKGEKKADGGRVGLFMGGPALEGQALQIYNSMKGYNFSDQEIADALSARGLYTPAGSGTTTQPEQVTGIIGAQIGRDRDDGPQGDFGDFGNLLKDTEKTFIKDVYTEIAPGKFDFVPTEVIGYQNVKTGNYQTKEGKNIDHLGIEVPTIAGMLFDKNFGKGPQPGDIKGTFTDGIPPGMKNFFSNPFGLFKKQQATIADINAMNKKAVDDMKAKQAAEEAAARRELENRIISGGAVIQGSGDDGRGNITTSAGTFAPGDYSDVAGTLADPREKMDFYKDGGLATMFTRRR